MIRTNKNIFDFEIFLNVYLLPWEKKKFFSLVDDPLPAPPLLLVARPPRKDPLLLVPPKTDTVNSHEIYICVDNYI